MLDLVIRGGQVVDGTGAPRRRADVGVKDGRVVKVGRVDFEASEVIDATGKVVTPGFIDVHTHFDAQVFWDPALTPAPLHGVTTVVAGNCGFTIAPLSNDPEDASYLMRMLSRVEGMPLQSLESGVPWDWKTTADYFDAIEGNVGINIGFLVGHSTLRRVAMGGDATVRRATDLEVMAMQRHLEAGLDAGALGFSSSWSRTHNDADGNMVPSRFAGREELVTLASTVSRYEGTSLEFIPMVGPQFEPWAFDLMAEMSAAAQRTLNWNVLLVTADSYEHALAKLEGGTIARSRGGKVVALTAPMSFPLYLSFRTGVIFDAIPGWEEVMLLPIDKKLAVFSDPAQVARLNDLAQLPTNPLSHRSDWPSYTILDVVAPENEQYRGRLLSEIAAEQGRDPWESLCDIVRADELKTVFAVLPPPESDDDWRARLAIWRDPRAMIGASDAGAHLDMVASFNFATELLSKAVRERKVLSLEEAVHHITDAPAQLYGLRDRGRVAEGSHADLVVLDEDVVASQDVQTCYDLPGGAGRLYAGANGVEHVLVNGRSIVRFGKLTESRSGTLLRAGRDTTTPSLV